MAADLSIHVLTDNVTEQDLANFFSHTMGSKYFDLRAPNRTCDESWRKISDTPQCWIGEVSWLKAALFADEEGVDESFIPNPVGVISEVIGESLPVINDELIGQIVGAFDKTNDTSYSIADPDEVKAFLEQHRGKPVFTVSW